MDWSKIEKAIKAAEAKAKELGTLVSIAIVDDHGYLIGFSRMEGALPISSKFSVAKAYTAGTIGMPTEDISVYAAEGKPFFGINTMLGGEFTILGGGLPVKSNNRIVGGIGVGGSYEVKQDIACAKAALAEFE